MLKIPNTAPLFVLFLPLSVSCPKHPKPRAETPSIKAKAWEYDPVVKVCSTAPVTTEEVQWALNVWADQGAPQLTAISSSCYHTEFDQGAVIVDIPQAWMYPEWEAYMRAMTVVFSDEKDSPVHLAYIGLPSGDPRTLLHEVGHIWLAGHIEDRPHVMSTYIEDFAWDFSGVRAAFRGH